MPPASPRHLRAFVFLLTWLGMTPTLRADSPTVAMARTTPQVPSAAHWKFIPLRSAAFGQTVFDARRHRAILFPPYFSDLARDLWVLDTRHPDGWHVLSTQGNPPPFRDGRACVYDPVRDRVLLWGGTDYYSTFVWGNGADLWTLDLRGVPRWSHVEVKGPTPPDRLSPAMVYDPRRERMLMFGGLDSAWLWPRHFHNDVWELKLSGSPKWRALEVTGSRPSPRNDLGAAYDPLRDRLLISGGIDSDGTSSAGGPRSDTWALSLSGPLRWTRLHQGAGGTDGRADQQLFYDARGDRLLMIGGRDSLNYYVSGFRGEVQSLTLGPDPQLSTLVAAPDIVTNPAAWQYGAAFDPERSVLFSIGPTQKLNEVPATWQLDLRNAPRWDLVAPIEQEPQPRFGAAQAYDARRGRTVFYGGRFTRWDGEDYLTNRLEDTWTLDWTDRPNWSRLVTDATHPPTRQFSTMLADPDGDRMWLFGGNITTDIFLAAAPAGADVYFNPGVPHFYDDLWRLDLGSPAKWTAIAPGGARPGPRDGHTMVLDVRRHRMLLFGGRDSLGAKNDVWAMSLDPPIQWTLLRPNGPPPSPRAFAIAGFDAVADRMLVFGGNDGAGGASKTDLWELDFGDRPSWSPVLTSGSAPVTRSARPGYFDSKRRRMVVVGGGEGSEAVPATLLSILSIGEPVPTWSSVPVDGAVLADAVGRTATWDEAANRMIVLWGTHGSHGQAVESFASQIALDDPAPRRTPALVPIVRSSLLSLDTPSPNPARVGFLARGVLPSGSSASLELIDLAGRRVRHEWIEQSIPGPFTQRFAIDGIPAGLYWLRLAQGASSATVKVVVIR